MEKGINMIKFGPTRRKYGKLWKCKGEIDIAEIYINHGVKIISLQFLYVEDGSLVMSPKFGGSSAPNFNRIKLDYPSEFLTGMSIEYDDYYAPGNAVSAITFSTNKSTYGPFGRPERDIRHKYNYDLGPDRSLGGLHGSATKSYVESVGLYVRPTTQPVGCSANDDGNTTTSAEWVEEEDIKGRVHIFL